VWSSSSWSRCVGEFEEAIDLSDIGKKKKKYHSLHLLIAGWPFQSTNFLLACVFSNVFSFSYVIVDDFSIFSSGCKWLGMGMGIHPGWFFCIFISYLLFIVKKLDIYILFIEFKIFIKINQLLFIIQKNNNIINICISHQYWNMYMWSWIKKYIALHIYLYYINIYIRLSLSRVSQYL